MTAPLTESTLEQIRQRHDLARRAIRAGAMIESPIAASATDVGPLLRELERLADLVSNAWLALDMVAHDAEQDALRLRAAGHDGLANDIGGLAHVAAKVLRQQGAPGWVAKQAVAASKETA